MMIDSTDTIVAISTPPGENGIGIVRMSGPSALKIIDKIFVPKNDKVPSEFKSHTIHYGHIVERGRRIDEVLVTIMHGPKTYTREDMVEVNCHGGAVAMKEVLDLIVSLGVRMAEPGEFTKRAFLSGRIDLVQAEAVLDIITSRTDDSLKVAQRQLNGRTSQEISKIRSKLVEIMAEIEADINFPEEDLGTTVPSSVKTLLYEAEEGLSRLIESSGQGLILREGITTVICGKPNVGKSSLMNSFLGQERVIVTPIPGTTRDTIEEVVNVKGIPLRIVDTAGIIHSEDLLIKKSVQRSRHYMEIADLILLVLDSSDKLNKQDFEIIDLVKDKKTLVVINKTDLPEMLQIEEIKWHLYRKRVIRISAKEGSGLNELEEAIYDMFWSGGVATENILVSNSRHIEALRKALAFTKGAIKGIGENRPSEFLAVDIRDAACSLDVITGETLTGDLLRVIFNRFCVGK